ncbi:class I SAM-dependent methyltransferase [Phyllobacterium meliloti]|uniref:class I SAM-dependent methyltransferase n=1 Tax=Phyllobacterium meliloti TaxID=555317 RepID=UPI001D139954|nr:class I SAM-dependent methyltransferase [Phyllobacterium sp. T1293]UGX86194.1 class I SAM-dependent methyltransferase [Phyllobacterium sp. T1293]
MEHSIRNTAMYVAGIVFLGLAWAKNKLRGYTTPNKVDRSDTEGRIEYVYDTVASWRRYFPSGFDVRDKDVLELCPGSSLGTGAILLGYGAKSYRAVDVFELAGTESGAYFSALLDRFPEDEKDRASIIRAKQLTGNLDSDSFSYRVGRNFDIPELAGHKKYDLILSCAAFEHYDDIEETIANMSKVARSGCIAEHIVDYQTHSRWIREADPNNIYRYSEGLYRLFSFPGQPNRRRPVDYVRAFEANGWKNVRVINARAIAPEHLARSVAGMASPFDRPEMQMDMLSGVVIAEWP